jgi:hypothetical protein
MDAGFGCAFARDAEWSPSAFGTCWMFCKLWIEATFVIKLLMVDGKSKVTPDEYGE